MKALLIAEKPSLKRTIEEVYNKGHYPDQIDFTSFAGHIIRLKEPREYKNELWQQKKWSYDMLPMIPDNFEYTVASDKTKMYKELTDKLKNGNYDYIINACDPDREGNHIFQLFYDYSKCKLPIKRFWTNDLTDKAVDFALRNLRSNGDGKKPNLKTLTDAAVMRGHFDWLTGMNFTIAETLSIGTLAKVGRVKSPTLVILGKREEELKNFKPKTTYGLESIYKEGFSGSLFDKNGEVIKDKKIDFNDIISKLGKTAIVDSVEGKKEKTYAPKLYNMTALQHDAGNAFGYDANETLATAQSLYEKKITTYPRSDCPYISTELTKSYDVILKAIASNPDFTSIVANIKAEDRKRAETSSDYINDKELNKAGHSAIIPTGNIPDWKSLSEKERNVAILIFKRFLAIFLPPIIADKTTVITNNNGYTFKTNGKIVVDKGYSILYDTNFKDVQLPTLKKGDTVNVDKFDVKEKVTKPPKRYTDAELVVVMEKPGNFLDDENLKEILKEKKGIGTEATRAGIIEELEKNGYIEKKKGKGKAKTIYVTEQGMFLYHNIKNKDFGKVDMTAIWETKLSEIENDELSVKDFEKEMIQYVIDSIEDIKNTQTVGSFNGTQIATIGTCPKCKNGEIKMLKDFYCCEHYRKKSDIENDPKPDDCDFAFSKNIWGARISENEARKIINGDITKEFTMKKDDKSWTAALWFNPETQKVEFAPRNNNLGTCPCCGGNVKATKDYYLCENYKSETNPSCNFIVGKNVFGASITENDMKQILAGEKTRTLKMHKGDKKWDAQLMYLPEEKKVGFAPRNNETLGTCPCCGGNVKATKDYYLCESYKSETNPSCNFIVGKNVWGANVTENDMKQILAGEKTRTLNMHKGDKKWSAQLMYLPEEKKVGFAPKDSSDQNSNGNTSNIIGVCPCCGKNVKETAKYYLCENYKSETDTPCNFIFGKDIWGAKISVTEAKKILSGKETKEFDMTNGSKKWKAKLVYNKETQKVEFASKK